MMKFISKSVEMSVVLCALVWATGAAAQTQGTPCKIATLAKSLDPITAAIERARSITPGRRETVFASSLADCANEATASLESVHSYSPADDRLVESEATFSAATFDSVQLTLRDYRGSVLAGSGDHCSITLKPNLTVFQSTVRSLLDFDEPTAPTFATFASAPTFGDCLARAIPFFAEQIARRQVRPEAMILFTSPEKDGVRHHVELQLSSRSIDRGTVISAADHELGVH